MRRVLTILLAGAAVILAALMYGWAWLIVGLLALLGGSQP
jgi:hypothetical protein